MREKLSIVIPVYNEEKTLERMFRRLRKTRFPAKTEIIMVDDGSQDRSYEIMRRIGRKNKGVVVSRNPSNMGKGAAVARGFGLATGTIVTIQDADLEYDPNDLSRMLGIMLEGKHEVLYGIRPFKSRRGYMMNLAGNFGLSLAFSLLYLRRVKDIETCYKMFRREVISGMRFECRRFDFEIEITAKIARSGRRIRFMDISYNPRSYEEGKKINWKDGFIAVRRMVKYRFQPAGRREALMEPLFRRLRTRRILRHLSGTRELLDIGCGPDFGFLRLMSPFVSTCVGIDQLAESTSSGNIRIIRARLTGRLPLKSLAFDAVTMLAVLEHLDNPEGMLAESYRILRHGGRLILTVPTPRAKPVLEFLAFRIGIVSKREIAEHKNYFTTDSLRDMIKSAGFKDIQLEKHNLGMNCLAAGRK